MSRAHPRTPAAYREAEDFPRALLLCRYLHFLPTRRGFIDRTCSLFRGKGPLKNTSDVISAAKKIAEAGSRMDKLGRTIADHVSDTLRGLWLRKLLMSIYELTFENCSNLLD